MGSHTLTTTTTRAAFLAGVTYRQLDYWCRCGYVTPEVDAHGSGTRRLFTAQQVAVLAVLGKVSGHVPIGKLGELSALLNEWPLDQWEGRVLLVEQDGAVWRADADDPPPVATAVRVGMLIPDAVRHLAPGVSPTR